jgi:hypothetical protein
LPWKPDSPLTGLLEGLTLLYQEYDPAFSSNWLIPFYVQQVNIIPLPRACCIPISLLFQNLPACWAAVNMLKVVKILWWSKLNASLTVSYFKMVLDLLK